jgi:hypothetical protein
LAIAAFVVSFAFVLCVIWPWTFRLVLDPKILVEDHIEKTPEELAAYLAEIWGRNYDLNQKMVLCIHNFFRLACISLLVEVVIWIVKLGRG